MNIEIIPSSLLDLFLKSTVLLTLALLMIAAFRRVSAANRHAIGAAAFMALLLLPGTKLLPPQWSFDFNQRLSDHPADVTVSVTTGSEISHPEMQAAEAAVSMVEPWLDIPWRMIGVVIWLSGVTFFLARRFWISLCLASVVRRSSSLETGGLATLARKLVRSSGLHAEVRVSSECRVPLVSGVLHPLVLLPVEAGAWPEELFVSALQHELGHVRRRDSLTRLLVNIVCAFYWVNPLVWIAARKLRLSQEHACDDIVLNGGASAEKYAGQLVEVVRNLQGDRFISQHAMAMAQPSTLETRVRAIVDDTRDRSPCLRRGVFCGMAFVCVALVLGTAAQFCGAVERKVVPEEGDSPSIAQPDETPRLNIRDEKKASTVADKTTARVPLVFIESRFVEISEDASQPANPVPLPEGLTEAGNNTPGVVGVLTEKQFQTVFKQLTQKKGVDLMTTPSVTARSNQVATIEVVREFVYPSEFDKDKQNGDMKPKNFETKKVGVILGVTGVIQPDNTIDLNLKPQVVEFEGFNKGKNGEQQPVFSERKLNTDVAVLPGQTVVMALGSKTDTQTVEDRVWFFFKKKSTHTVNRRVLVFVTAKIIKPVIAEKSVTITSDSLEYDKATGAVTATGNVKIETPQAVITADKAGIKTNAEATAPQSDRKEK